MKLRTLIKTNGVRLLQVWEPDYTKVRGMHGVEHGYWKDVPEVLEIEEHSDVYADPDTIARNAGC